MQNMILATPVLSDAASLTGTASSGDLGINNLQKMSLKQVYRAASNMVTVQVDLSASKTVNMFALIGHSGSSRSFARLVASDTVAGLDTPSFDTGLVPFRSHQTGYDASWAASVADESFGALEKNMFFKFFNRCAYRYWRITIQDPNAAYIDIGRLYIADAWQPAINMEYGVQEGFTDNSRKVRTVGGETINVERKKFRWCEFTLGYLTKEEVFSHAFQIENTRGATKDVLMVIDPDEVTYLQYRSYYGMMENIQPKTNPQFGLFSKAFRIEEIIP